MLVFLDGGPDGGQSGDAGVDDRAEPAVAAGDAGTYGLRLYVV